MRHVLLFAIFIMTAAFAVPASGHEGHNMKPDAMAAQHQVMDHISMHWADARKAVAGNPLL